MPPLAFLLAVVGFTSIALLAASISRRRAVARLGEMAHQWQMRFVPDDRFGLTPQVVARLAVPGAADIFLTDLIHAQTEDHFRYFFTLEYTVGVLRGHERLTVVATLTESRRRTGWEQYSPLELAPAELPLLEQYRWLKESTDKSAV